MAMLMDVSAAVSLVNIGILAVLLAMYGRIYRNTRAVFTLGLMFFAGMLVLHNAIAVYGYFAMAPLYAEALLPYFVGVHIAELAGIATLLKVTLRPL
ncbi:hypothetical protein [Nitrososphaera viennensis]|uniref:Uncharacterized protein n=2 Tax=Nitrososphaera viennensis TaxID=1034015 RepID=A0A060HST6_9ARCH|nr:hypothetical protein [Nitrososphaera viennensis]AIC16536.1 hypothetical protein NVIE_022750 [Nitrososphaera viennensis EN76]UVS68469.1 hypothetical protein NWT39_11225 [Nitrososphaera viennensis]